MDKESDKSISDLLGEGVATRRTAPHSAKATAEAFQKALGSDGIPHSAKATAEAFQRIGEEIRDAQDKAFKSSTGANITRGQWLDELRESRKVAALDHQALRNWKHHGSFAETLGSVSSVAPAIQQTSIRSLEPIFKKFTDTEVSVYAMDDQPIGPRIGVADVPEPTLKAIASFEVQRRGRISDKTWYIVGGGIATLVTGIVVWFLRGVLGV